MTILWSNNASTTVSGSITATSTTVALAAGTGALFPQPTGGNYYVATFYDQATKTQNEIVHVTAMSGDTATIVRAQEGTVAQAWNAGDIFANLVTAGTLEQFVQAGTGPADTSVVYVGTDTSATPNHIVAVTNPVPPNYAVGMLFNIKVANANTGPTDLQLNGVPAVLAKRTDGSDLIGGNIFANQEYTFVYNGQFFQTAIQHVPIAPPQTTFYVRPDSTSIINGSGIESNSGFANTPTSAFLAIQGAINTIKASYISASGITIRVADGTYTSGFTDDSQYIAAWIIIGNTSSPGNVSIVATSTNSSTYVPGAPGGMGVACGPLSNMSVQGMSFQSYTWNALSEGNLSLTNCYFSAPTSGASAICAATGILGIFGACQYTGATASGAIFNPTQGGDMSLGYYSSVFGNTPLTMTIVGNPTITGAVALATNSSTMNVYDEVFSMPGGTCQGLAYHCSSAGGIAFHAGNTGVFKASQPGVVDAPAANNCGGWIAL